MINQLKKSINRLLSGDTFPCIYLSQSPLIIFSYFHDFYTHHRQIAKIYQNHGKIQLIFQLGWHVETPERIKDVADKCHELLTAFEAVELTILCNSPQEAENLSQAGLTAHFCHQNAFLDENRYPLYQIPKRFDAIYLARITPFKRHLLAQKINSLSLIGNYHPREEVYAQTVLEELKFANWRRKISGKKVSRAMAEAHCGLCLSGEEGAMFVCAEYLLSGLPIVSTRNLGGRLYLTPEPYVILCEDNADSVAESVEQLITANYQPEAIRQAMIELMQPHRDFLLKLINEILEKHQLPAKTWHEIFLHKMGLRTNIGFKNRKRLLPRKPNF